MNKPISAKDVAPPKVTTGPLAGSRKVYSSPQGHDDVRVPFREIALTDGRVVPASTTRQVPTPTLTPASMCGEDCCLCAQAGSQTRGEGIW